VQTLRILAKDAVRKAGRSAWERRLFGRSPTGGSKLGAAIHLRCPTVLTLDFANTGYRLTGGSLSEKIVIGTASAGIKNR